MGGSERLPQLSTSRGGDKDRIGLERGGSVVMLLCTTATTAPGFKPVKKS